MSRELVLIEIKIKLLAKALHVEHGQVGIDIGEGAAHGGFEIFRLPGHAQLDVADVIGTDHARVSLRVLVLDRLQKGQKERGIGGPPRILILRVFNDADDFIVGRVTRAAHAEVLTHRIFLGENLCAKVSLTTAMGRSVGVSSSPITRPRSKRVPMVSK
jgi:hypothetical protein